MLQCLPLAAAVCRELQKIQKTRPEKKHAYNPAAAGRFASDASPNPAGTPGLERARFTVRFDVITRSSLTGMDTVSNTSPGGKKTFVFTEV